MGDLGLIPGLGRSPGAGNGNPLQCSCLENPIEEEPGGLQSMGLQSVRHNQATDSNRHNESYASWSFPLSILFDVSENENWNEGWRLLSIGGVIDIASTHHYLFSPISGYPQYCFQICWHLVRSKHDLFWLGGSKQQWYSSFPSLGSYGSCLRSRSLLSLPSNHSGHELGWWGQKTEPAWISELSLRWNVSGEQNFKVETNS